MAGFDQVFPKSWMGNRWREKLTAETSQLFVLGTKSWFGVTEKKRSEARGGKVV